MTGTRCPLCLPLAHRDRGLSVAHRHRPGDGAGRPLRAGLDARSEHTRTGRWNFGRSGLLTESSPKKKSRSPEPWQSKYGSRRSCAPTPAARRPSTAQRGTLAEVIDSVESDHPGHQGAPDRGRRPAPLHQRLRQRRGRPVHRRARRHGRRRRRVVILPAVAGG